MDESLTSGGAERPAAMEGAPVIHVSQRAKATMLEVAEAGQVVRVVRARLMEAELVTAV